MKLIGMMKIKLIQYAKRYAIKKKVVSIGGELVDVEVAGIGGGGGRHAVRHHACSLACARGW